MPSKYWIVQYEKPKTHKAGSLTKDIRRLTKDFSSKPAALQVLYQMLFENRNVAMDSLTRFARVYQDMTGNAVAYGDFTADGGRVRFLNPNGHPRKGLQSWRGDYRIRSWQNNGKTRYGVLKLKL